MGGNLALARQQLERATALRPGDTRAWLWLSATTTNPHEQLDCLQRALAADPNNGAAARGLSLLRAGWTAETGLPAAAPGNSPAQQQVFDCPQCGGRLAFDIGQQEVVCQFCGYLHQTAKLLTVSEGEQALTGTLFAGRGKRWAEGHHSLACQQCGAISLLPGGALSDRCPYCGSNRLVRPPEVDDLAEPLLIALIQVDEAKAHARLKTWLSKGGLTPDDLVAHVERIQLQATYFPFWTFDGMLELPWHAEVNEGTSKNPVWVSVNGRETEVFDDILLPGIQAQPVDEIRKIEPFNLKDLVAFEPHLLAGWPAITNDIPLATASLQAREAIMRRVRPNLYGRVSSGREMRNLDTGTPNWHAMTYKLVLLPLWVGIYTYQGQQRRALINGQTGKVSGSRPRNYFKLFEVSLAAILSAVVLLILLSIGLSFLPG
jgi:DNA-directed RNA polymerase subunit RPC12/RpoP